MTGYERNAGANNATRHAHHSEGLMEEGWEGKFLFFSSISFNLNQARLSQVIHLMQRAKNAKEPWALKFIPTVAAIPSNHLTNILFLSLSFFSQAVFCSINTTREASIILRLAQGQCFPSASKIKMKGMLDFRRN